MLRLDDTPEARVGKVWSAVVFSTSMGRHLGVLGIFSIVMAVEACDTFSAVDGTPADAGPPAEAGGASSSDGGAPEAASRRFCEGSDASFCADFDGVTVGEGWTESGPPLGGTLEAVDGGTSTALRASIKKSPGGAVAAALEKVLSGTVNRVAIAFDLRVVQVHPTSFAQLFTVRFEGSAFQVSLYTGDRPGVDSGTGNEIVRGLNEWPLPSDAGGVDPAPFEHVTPAVFADGGWHRIELRLGNAVGGAPAFTTLLVDGSNVLTYYPSIGREFRGPVRVYGGLSYVVSRTEDVVAEYDAVEVRIE